jgi:hypothetical protein
MGPIISCALTRIGLSRSIIRELIKRRGV